MVFYGWHHHSQVHVYRVGLDEYFHLSQVVTSALASLLEEDSL